MSGFVTAWQNAALQAHKDDGPWYLGLFTTLPAENGVGGVEVSAPEYERQLVIYGVPSGGIIENTNTITWPQPASVGGYGAIVGFGIFSDSSPGVSPTPEVILQIPTGPFTMPQGYDRSMEPGYLIVRLRATNVGN